MSDYLWDKTGAPEEDVEQLENLLGTLKYQPRPLEIPASAMPTTARPAQMFFSRPRLAIAASLLLTLLAGTWFVTRQTEQQPDRLATVDEKSKTAQSSQTATPDDLAHDLSGYVGSSVFVPKPEKRLGNVMTSSPKTQRAPRRLMAKRQKLQPRVDEKMPVAPRELIASTVGMRWEVEQPMTPQQREATEQLMLALQVASAKFNYAQREMQEIGRARK